MSPDQIAYIASAGIAWLWAGSQIKLAIHELRSPDTSWWRVNAAQWLVVKAVFITYIGVAAWESIPDHDAMVYLFLISHLIAFLHWLRLPSPAKTDPLYLTKGDDV